jgi:alcohol dehydrogenase (cytochrome c)
MIAVAFALGLTALALPGCSSEDAASAPSTPSPYANVDAANTRYPQSSIRKATVGDLDVAWAVPIEAEGQSLGGYVATPVVSGGVVYSQDQDSNVQAIDFDNGEVIWEATYDAPTNGPNGVVVGGGLVYGATPTRAFALDAESGEEAWSQELVRSVTERIMMAPGYRDGLVYFSTRPYESKGGDVGILWALDAKTGKRAWHFDTVPRGLWGHPELNSGGGLSYAPAFDEEGSMYVGVGNPGPIPGTKRFPWGSSRPGANLYSSSVVKLDAKTGKVQWHYQVTPHAICNWDVGAPLLTRAGGRDIVVAGSLAGIVVALDRETGKPLWRSQVGIHNGHDNDGLLAMRGETASLKTPMTVYPGKYGGVLGPMSTNGSTVFVPVVNTSTTLFDQRRAEETGATAGELVALDAASGKVKWQRRFEAPVYGAALATNDVVFAAIYESTVHAFDAENGEPVWTETVPANLNAGLAASGSTLLVPAGFPEETQTPVLLAYRLPE